MNNSITVLLKLKKACLLFCFLIISNKLWAENIEKIQSDKVYILKEITVEGVTWTNPHYIKRLLNVKPGDSINVDTLSELKQKIENKGSFRNIHVYLKEAGKNEAILIVYCKDKFPLFGYPWGSYNSYSGFSGTIGFTHSNLTGNLDAFSFSTGLGWNPTGSAFPDSITSYNVAAAYYISDIPRMDKWGIGSNLNIGMYSSRRVDNQQEYAYWNDTHYINGYLSATYTFLSGVSISKDLSINRLWYNTKIADPEIPEAEDVFNLSPGISTSFSKMNYYDMGIEKEGWRVNFTESPSFNINRREVSNSISLTFIGALRPFPFLNSLLRTNYVNKINAITSLGGYNTYLRGFQTNEIATDNAVIINNENRIKIADNFLWGRISVVVFEDFCWSFDSFNFAGAEVLFGAGLGARYRHNVIGMTFKMDVAWNFKNFSQLPEIVFTIGELIQ